MKKLFTFVTGLLLAVCGYAAEPVALSVEGLPISFDKSWSQSFLVAKTDLKAGDKIIFRGADNPIDGWQWGPQLLPKSNSDGWPALGATLNMVDGECIYEVTEEYAADINANGGLRVQGVAVTVNEVLYQAGIETKEVALPIKEGNHIVASDFDKYPDNVEVRLAFENTTDPYDSRDGWGIGQISNINNWDPTDYSFSLKGKAGATFDIKCTIGDLKKAAKNGTDAYVASEYYDGGVTIQVYNNCKLTGAYVVLPLQNVEISVESGDISEAIDKCGAYPLDLTIKLKKDVTYTISSSISAAGNIFVEGNGATIDASSLNAPFIAMANVDSPTEWTNVSVGINNVTIKGLKNALFYSTCKNYWIEELIVWDCVVEVAADATTFDFTKGSAVHRFTIENSTFYAPTATTKSFFSSQAGQKITDCDAGLKQEFYFSNSTFYNLAKDKNFFTHRQNSQTWEVYDVKNNIFVNCGKSGQTIKGINGGGSSANPVWRISGNVFNFLDANTGVFVDTSAAEDTGDAEEPVADSVPGVMTFTDAANGDFNGVFVLDGNKPEKLGDPRWTITYKVQPVDIEISPESGDISEAIANAAAGKPINNLTISLKEDGTYTLSSSISAAGNIKIYSDGGATIDASSLTAPFIAMPNEEPTEWTIISNVTIADVTIKGLKNALFFSACKNYAIEDFMVIGSVVEVAGDATTFDFTKGSVVQNFNITNSTFYAPTATTKAFYSSQSGQKLTEWENSKQCFIFSNSTFYNLAKGKNFFSHRQSNQAWMEYDVQNNIFVNCGKSGQTIKGMNGGQGGANPTWIISGNAFNFDNAETNEREDTSAAESTDDEAEPVKDSVACIVTFTDAAAGNFNGTLELPEGAEAPQELGDPRWKFNITTGIQTVGTTVENGTCYDLQGRRVAQPVKGLYIVNGKKVVLK